MDEEMKKIAGAIVNSMSAIYSRLTTKADLQTHSNTFKKHKDALREHNYKGLQDPSLIKDMEHNGIAYHTTKEMVDGKYILNGYLGEIVEKNHNVYITTTKGTTLQGIDFYEKTALGDKPIKQVHPEKVIVDEDAIKKRFEQIHPENNHEQMAQEYMKNISGSEFDIRKHPYATILNSRKITRAPTFYSNEHAHVQYS